jgi:S-adenosyl-L-methionine hydrolase (adenosine-forming)
MIKPSGIVTLLTDFGLTDPFVGIMHGVLLRQYPDFKIVDLSHGIEPQNIAQAAFWLAASYRDFPEGTVHVVVVDPTVGSDRRPLIAEIDRHYFVAPDNGVLDAVCSEAEEVEIRALKLWQLNLKKVSRTFHGRDVFAPAAAEIGSGRMWLSELGDLIDDYARLEIPKAEAKDGMVRGEIVVIDHFGNLITNISKTLFEDMKCPKIRVGGREIPVRKIYSDVAPKEPVALVNAFDRLEIALRDGNAAATLGLTTGQVVEITHKT